MKKAILVPTIALFVICLVSTALLALANNVTAPIIDKLAIQTEIESRNEVLETAEIFEEKSDNGIDYVVGLDKDGNEIGMVFTSTAKSYGGEIIVMTGVDMEGKITGIKLLQINDTPGLGMNAQKPEFRDKFLGMSDKITIVKNSANAANNEIDALSGATISSNAVADAVNESLENFAKITGKAGAN